MPVAGVFRAVSFPAVKRALAQATSALDFNGQAETGVASVSGLAFLDFTTNASLYYKGGSTLFTAVAASGVVTLGDVADVNEVHLTSANVVSMDEGSGARVTLPGDANVELVPRPFTTGGVLVGASPSTIGLLRLQNPNALHGGTILSIRNNANTGNLRVFATDGVDDIVLGDSAGPGVAYVDGGTNGTVIRQAGSFAGYFHSSGIYFYDPSGNVALTFGLSASGATALTFAPGETSVTLTQTIRAGTGANPGAPLTLRAQAGQAQAGGAANNAGGKIVADTGARGTGGAGAAAIPGVFEWQAGGTQTMYLQHDPVSTDCRLVLGANPAYMLFAANAAGQGLYFQTLGVGGFVAFQAAELRLQDTGGANAIFAELASAGTSEFVYAATVTAATIRQADKATNGGTGATMKIQAQNETGTTSTGGALDLRSGTGTSAAGTINFNAGASALGLMRLQGDGWFFDCDPARTLGLVFRANTVGQALYFEAVGGQVFFDTPTVNFRDATLNVAWSTSLASAGTTSISFAQAVTAATLKQVDKTTNGGTGATFTVQAQNETGTTSTGGALDLRSGTGTTTAGALTLRAGATVRLTADGTGLGLYAAPAIAQGTDPGALANQDVGVVPSQASINAAINAVVARVNDWRNRLSQAAGGIGVTA